MLPDAPPVLTGGAGEVPAGADGETGEAPELELLPEPLPVLVLLEPPELLLEPELPSPGKRF